MQQTTQKQKTTLIENVCERVDNGQISAKEGSIILKWLDSKTTLDMDSKKRLVSVLVSVRQNLCAPLDSISSIEVLRAIPAIIHSSEKKNTQQKRLTTFKNFLEFRQHFGVQFENYDYMMKKIKPGTSDRNAKTAKDLITRDQFSQIMAECALNAQEKAHLMLMWDGCLRPFEAYTLRWSDMRDNDIETKTYTVKFKTEKPRTIRIKPDTFVFLECYRDEIKENWDSDQWIFPRYDGMQYTSLKVLRELFARLRTETGLMQLKPSCIRPSAITDDCYHHSIKYVSKRCWGDELNLMVNTYAKTDSEKIQQIEEQTEIKAIPKVLERSQSEMQKQIDDLQKMVEMLLKERNK